MGSKSDWDTMRHAADMLEQSQVPLECRVLAISKTARGALFSSD